MFDRFVYVTFDMGVLFHQEECQIQETQTCETSTKKVQILLFQSLRVTCSARHRVYEVICFGHSHCGETRAYCTSSEMQPSARNPIKSLDVPMQLHSLQRDREEIWHKTAIPRKLLGQAIFYKSRFVLVVLVVGGAVAVAVAVCCL
eukprot:2397965-Amphidinium_carterae.1